MARIVLLFLCVASLAGCGAAARQAHPDGVLVEYVEALEAGDLDRAYGLLSQAQQRRMSREEFRAAADAYPEEVEEEARQLRRQLAEPVPVRAELRGSGGESASFVLEGGRWHIVEGAAGAVALDSPIQAVRALRRALVRGSYPAILRVLSRESRAVVEDEVARIAEGLSDEEALQVEIRGNRARVLYDDTHFVELVREDDEWVVVDID